MHAALPARNETGTWPAHWLMPNPSTASPPNVCWPVGGEIDIMEVCWSLHWQAVRHACCAFTQPVGLLASHCQYTANPLINPIYGSYRWGTKCGDNKQVCVCGGMCDAACPASLHRCLTCFGGGGGWGLEHATGAARLCVSSTWRPCCGLDAVPHLCSAVE